MHPACTASAFSYSTFTSTNWQISFSDKQTDKHTDRQTHKSTTVTLAHARRGLTSPTEQ